MEIVEEKATPDRGGLTISKSGVRLSIRHPNQKAQERNKCGQVVKCSLDTGCLPMDHNDDY